MKLAFLHLAKILSFFPRIAIELLIVKNSIESSDAEVPYYIYDR